MRPRLILLAAISAALILPASSPAATIWAPVSSGTTEEISAIDYRPDALRFTTTSGKIFKGPAGGPFTQELSIPGRQFLDIAMNPAGTLGLATADSGKLYRFSGGTWTLVDLTNDSWAHECPFSTGSFGAQTPTANLLAAAWSSDTVAWVVSAAPGQVLKSTDGGATFADASRRSDGTCRIKADVTDVAPIPGSDQDVYFVDDYFAGLWRTADQLASTAQRRDELVNCFSIVFRLAVDPAAPNRASALGPCEGSLHWGFTADAGTTSNYTESAGAKLRDISAQSGVFIGVGDAGQIEQTFDGRTVFPQPAEGALATKDWRAVDFSDASHAAVGGVGGALAITDRANEMPDVVAPTVTISGPDSVAANAATVFTANATDNAGGVGVDPAGFQWTGTGLAPSTAATATYTFPGPGTYTLRVKARDLRGNTSEDAVKVVNVTAAVLPAVGFPASATKGVSVKRKGRYLLITIKGTLLVPAGVAKASVCPARNKIKGSVRKGKKVLKSGRANLSRSCSYRKTLKVLRRKVGRARRLTVRVEYPGTAQVRRTVRSYRVKVR